MVFGPKNDSATRVRAHTWHYCLDLCSQVTLDRTSQIIYIAGESLGLGGKWLSVLSFQQKYNKISRGPKGKYSGRVICMIDLHVADLSWIPNPTYGLTSTTRSNP